MKTKLQIMLTVLLIMAAAHVAQSQRGIYLTAADYMAGHTSYGQSRVRLNNSVWDGQYITVIDNGNKVRLRKSGLYGYVGPNKQTYRIYHNTSYRIADSGNIMIYILDVHVAKSKGFDVAQEYFFSTSALADIEPLTRANLENAYSSNRVLLDKLQLYGGDMTGYDNAHHTYTINYIFSESIK